MGPVVLHATFTAQSGFGDRVAELLADYATLVKSEPGNRVFEASRHLDNPDAFFVFEVYADESAFSAHLLNSAGAAFNAALVPLIVEPSSKLTFLQPVA